MAEMLFVDSAPVGKTAISEWVRDHADTLGKKYRSELSSLLKKSLLNRTFKNSKCKEQKKFKVDAYLDRFEFELFEATQQLGDFQRSVSAGKTGSAHIQAIKMNFWR